MPAKRYSVEQIVAKLREAEKHQAQGLTNSPPTSTSPAGARKRRRDRSSRDRAIPFPFAHATARFASEIGCGRPPTLPPWAAFLGAVV